MAPSRCLRFVVAIFFVAGSAVGLAAGLNLPPIAGELSGNLAPLALPGAPSLHWKINTQRPASALQEVNLEVDGPGTRARVAAELTASDAGKWRLRESRIDLATWLPAAMARWPVLQGVELNGAATLSGEGEFEGQSVHGRMLATLVADRVSMPAKNIEAEGVALTVELNSLMPAATAEGQVLTVRTVRAAGVTLSDVRVVFSLTADGQVRVAEASLAVLGGRASLAPFATKLLVPAIATTVIVEKLSLAELSPFLPKSVAAAQGLLNGSIGVTWSEADGFAAGNGAMALDVNVAASVRLAPAPGFLSSRVPARFELLPSWAGPLQRWFSADNPAYATLRAIEMGETSLIVQTLSVQLGPTDGVEGRTASVRLVAHPPNSDVVKQVGFDINVAGPLADVIGLGLKQKISITTH